MRAIPALILVLTACTTLGARPDGPMASLEVRPERLSPGDSLTLVLRNTATEPLGYNLCTSDLERRHDADWQPLPSDRVCTMELRSLAPDQQAEYGLQIPDTLRAGVYRYSTAVEWLDQGLREVISSNSFEVRR